MTACVVLLLVSSNSSAFTLCNVASCKSWCMLTAVVEMVIYLTTVNSVQLHRNKICSQIFLENTIAKKSKGQYSMCTCIHVGTQYSVIHV